MLLLAAGLVGRWPVTVPAALTCLGGAYALLLLVEDSPLDTSAPVLAAALLLVAELAYLSLELRDAVRDEPGTFTRRLALLAGLALVALGVGELLVVLVDLDTGGGLALEAAGVAAAIAALALVAIGARQQTS